MLKRFFKKGVLWPAPVITISFLMEYFYDYNNLKTRQKMKRWSQSCITGLNCKTGWALVCMLSIWMFFSADPIAGQASETETNGSGTIYGEVRDISTGEVLTGANVVVKGTTIGVATDMQGRYMLRRVPSGEIALEVTYLGYINKEIEVVLDQNERLEVNIGLQEDYIEGDEVFITAQQRGQSRALTLQRQSVSIRSVISSEQMEQFGDVTVSGALQRIAGMGHGGSNIRGIGAGSANITMDGQRMGSTGEDRSADVSTISADMVQQLEVVKVITPDMDADALSGTININTRRPIGGARTINIRLGGSWNSRLGDHVGPGARFSFSYGDSPRDNFSYGINLSYQRSANASEHVRTDWEWRNFEQIEGPSDVLIRLRNGITYDPRDRIAGGAQFTLQPTDRSTFFIMTNVNYEHKASERYELQTFLRDFVSPFQTGGVTDPGRAGDLRYEMELDEANIYQFTARVGARHLFDGFEMDYKLGWGHGRNNNERYLPRYTTLKAFEHSINFDRGNHHPILEILPSSQFPEFPDKSRFFNRADAVDEEELWDFHKSNDFNGSVDFHVPFDRSSLKFGSSAIMAFIDGRSERFVLANQRRLELKDFDTHVGREVQVFDRSHQTYHLPYIMDLHQIRDYSRTYRPYFDMDLEKWALEAETSLYNAREATYAGYVMGTANIGRFRLIGGVRMEHTNSRYAGRAGTIDDEARFRGAVDTLANVEHTGFFPNAQMIFQLGKMTNVRLAYSRSIGRPTLTQLSPSTLWDYSSERITQGNPNLKPLISDNLDLLFEHYFMNVGQFTVGLYYKFLNDFIFNMTERIGPEGIDGTGLYARWRRNTLLNGDEARAYGLEVSWQQNLNFLPGFLGNLGTYANYSYAASEADIDRPGQAVRLQDQRPHVVNAGLNYTQSRFFTQISYAWGSPSISSYGNLDFAPTLYGDSKRVYMDQFRDAANDMTITVRYRLSDTFRIWADASNVLNHKSISYTYDRQVYPQTQRLSGRTISMGLRYTF